MDYKQRQFNKDRLAMLYRPSNNPNPHLSRALIFGPPKNGPEINFLKHLEQISPEARTELGGQAYALLVKAINNHQMDFDRVAG